MRSSTRAVATEKLKKLFITGDLRLVTEYAAACAGRGYMVQARPQPEAPGEQVPPSKLPRGIAAARRPGKSVTLALELSNTDIARKRENLRELDDLLPPAIPILTSAVAVLLAEQAPWVKHPERLVGIGAFPTLLGGSLIEFSALDQTRPEARRAAQAFTSALGKEFVVVSDTPGMVLPRILCMIFNEACFALGEGLTTASDIDTAMKLGTNYPFGPLAWAEMVGPRHVFAVLTAIHAVMGDDRYRVAPALYHAAMLGSFHSHGPRHSRRSHA